MPFEPDKKPLFRQKRVVDLDPEFIETHPVKDKYMEVTVRKAVLSTKGKRPGFVEEQNVLVQPLGEVKDRVLDTDIPDNELPEGEYYVKSKAGRIFKLAIYDTLFRTDLKTLVKGQFFECPAQIFPTIADRMIQTARNEIKAKYPEKRKEEGFPFWVIAVIVMAISLVIGLSFMQ